MTKSNGQPTRAILITLMIRFFSSRYTIAIFDTIMTIAISVKIAKMDLTKGPDKILIILAMIQIAGNILCIFFGHISQKEKKVINCTKEAYNIHNDINYEMAGKLYEVNEIITKTIEDKKIKKDSINLLINFQKLSQDICEKLYNFIKTYFECEECEISIFQRFAGEQGDFVKMIAYKNNNIESTTPKKDFLLNDSNNAKYVFYKIFTNLEAKIKTLPNKKAVSDEFFWLEGSKDREQKICQYIGVPVKTKRDKVEFLLQIDVSEEKKLGKNEKELTEFAKKIIQPFSNLLYCSFERDLIFNKFYDILEGNIPQEEE